MSADFETRMVLAPLRPETVALLAGARQSESETLDAVVARLAALARRSDEAPDAAPPPPTTVRAKHRAEVLGEAVGATTLGALFAAVVDRIDAVAPEAIEALSRKRARTRAFVARARGEVHPGRPDLAVVQTGSGWWVSANVGAADVRRGLGTLCAVAGLEFGADIRFPIR